MRIPKVSQISFLLASACLCASCAGPHAASNSDTPPESPVSEVQQSEPVVALTNDEVAEKYASEYTLSDSTPSHYDQDTTLTVNEVLGMVNDDGIIETEINGHIVYHPVSMSWNLLGIINLYEETHDSRLLKVAQDNVKYLLDGSTVIDGSRWFEYQFEHSRGELRMDVPWVSGMAQGMVLSVLSRMYDITHDDKYIPLMREIFQSFSVQKSTEGHWFTNLMKCPDSSSECMYFEEYPAAVDSQNTHVVNGHMYAIIGLYDYYRITKDALAASYINAGSYAQLHSLDLYRNPGAPSYYAMTNFGHKTWGAPEKYHEGVIAELRFIAEICQNDEFHQQASLLEQDHS
ncbi:hypothetical protein G7Y41_02330 [Schaalia sp. ZJ405]|uniref:D-glucuronyl C5-epimerase family protein n=1 Tax=Schaalia sp. ZJ405 TaxID=2709403 RepID=UPI0013ECBCBF|nr:D-glucuronyl C5-epimerase family protein [Schaalia sp. ZJ405]QPK81693.1 hypothetical protein G7Y41_02330 [Schaalia sp. ZJ405]